LETVFREGLRVTTPEMRDAALMVFAGLLNKRIVALLHRVGGQAVGLSGVDAGLLQVERLREHRGKEIDLGYVGVIRRVNTDLLQPLLREGYIPVISSVGVDDEGEIHNINADHAAGAIAGALRAEKVIFLTDVRGILSDPSNEGSLVSRLTLAQARHLLEEGQLGGGMIPKVEGCLQALEQGVRRAHIIDGRIEHSLLMEIFTDEGIGTMIE
jgi:acetylglutamate kinase